MSFEDGLRTYIADTMKTFEAELNDVSCDRLGSEDLLTVLDYIDSSSAKQFALSMIQVPAMSYNCKDEIIKKYNDIAAENEQRREQIKAEYDAKRQQRKQNYEATVQDVEHDNESKLQPYREKHQALLQYKDELQHVFDYYNITPMSSQINEVTKQEFETLIDSSIEVCEKYKSREQAVAVKVLQPLDKQTDLAFTACYCLLILAVIYFILPIAAIPLFIFIGKRIHDMYEDIDRLKIADSLMHEVDYERFVDDDELEEVEQLTYDDLDEEERAILNSLDDKESERDEELHSYEEQERLIAEQLASATTTMQSLLDSRKAEIADYIKEAEEVKKKLLADYTPFPSTMNTSSVLSMKYVLARVKDTLDATVEIPHSNLVFNEEHDVAIKQLLLYLSNFILSVRPKQMIVEIYDPKNMCSDFTEFFSDDSIEYIKHLTGEKSLSQVIADYRKLSQNLVIELDKQNIDEFNTNAMEQGIPPKQYRLLIIVSGYEEYFKESKKNMFDEFLSFSTSVGIYFWILGDVTLPNCTSVQTPNISNATPIQYTTDIGRQAREIFDRNLAAYKDDVLVYQEKFGNILIPREKWWTYDTISGVNLYMGLEDGDPQKWQPLQLGDKQVHALLGGNTGSGKSATINQCIISLITQYPPSELQLLFIDFKNLEAAKFTRGWDVKKNEWIDEEVERQLLLKEQYYIRHSYIPHMKVLSGTTDGGYALSIFNYMMDEMARRQKIINKTGQTKIEEVRMDILKRYRKIPGKNPKATWFEMRQDWDWYKENVYDVFDGDLPRVVVIMDEFQQMFNPEYVDTKIIEQINAKLVSVTKLARAMSMHLWFTSQSMHGTLSADTLANFSLKMALYSKPEVSQELIGNDAASKLKAPRGFMVSNSNMSGDAKYNHTWRIPFLDPSLINPEYVDVLNGMLEEHNEKHLHAEFYDEKTLVPGDELLRWYEQYREFDSKRVFIAGERASFSINKAPVTMTMKPDSNENLLIYSTDKDEMMNLTMTAIQNIKMSGATMIMNCRDKRTIYAMGLEEIVDPQFASLLGPDQDVKELVGALEALVQSRQGMIETEPIYIILIQWENAPYVAADMDFNVQDRFKAIFTQGPEVDVHFIMSYMAKGELPRFMYSGMNHKWLATAAGAGYSFSFSDNMTATKLPIRSMNQGMFGIYEVNGQEIKFKNYQWQFKTQALDEVVL